MKNAITLLFFLYTSSPSWAQTPVNKHFPYGNAQQISLDFEFANVTLSTWDRPEVHISGSVRINNGENDDAFLLTSEKQGANLVIQAKTKDWQDLPKFTTVKKNGKTYHFKGELTKKEIEKELGESDFQWISQGVAQEIHLEVKVPAGIQLDIVSLYGNIKLQNCQNPLSAENTYGFIEASFEANLPSDIQLHSTYSFVDVSLPAKANAGIELTSNYGTVYTDHNIVIDKSKSKEENFSRYIVGQLNNGGKKLSVQADYHNIYLRVR